MKAAIHDNKSAESRSTAPNGQGSAWQMAAGRLVFRAPRQPFPPQASGNEADGKCRRLAASVLLSGFCVHARVGKRSGIIEQHGGRI